MADLNDKGKYEAQRPERRVSVPQREKSTPNGDSSPPTAVLNPNRENPNHLRAPISRFFFTKIANRTSFPIEVREVGEKIPYRIDPNRTYTSPRGFIIVPDNPASNAPAEHLRITVLRRNPLEFHIWSRGEATVFSATSTFGTLKSSGQRGLLIVQPGDDPGTADARPWIVGEVEVTERPNPDPGTDIVVQDEEE